MSYHKQELSKANIYINSKSNLNDDPYRPIYHFTPQLGWANDPNGFVYYQNRYHLFYQYHPYSAQWGPMHWGHASSADLIKWNHHDVALAPSEDYDKDGCFSGSAIEVENDLYLIYTGHRWTGKNHDIDLKQVQCLAKSSDGLTFEKCTENPVINEPNLAGVHPHHFRDPKIWKHEGVYYCVIGSRDDKNSGQVLIFNSKDLKDWSEGCVLAKGQVEDGYMWECPDFFELGEKHVLIYSPQGVKAEEKKFLNLHQSGYLIGDFDYENQLFNHNNFKLLDYGFDFYAPQTLIDNKGRRILVAWMAMWESDMPEQEQGWSGAFTLPRELTLESGELKIRPIDELNVYRKEAVKIKDMTLNERGLKIPGVCGTSVELKLKLNLQKAEAFHMHMRQSKEMNEQTTLSINPFEGELILDRTLSGEGPGGKRYYHNDALKEKVELRIFIDQSSIEVFVNDGLACMTARIYPNQSSNQIIFDGLGDVVIEELQKWTLEI